MSKGEELLAGYVYGEREQDLSNQLFNPRLF